MDEITKKILEFDKTRSFQSKKMLKISRAQFYEIKELLQLSFLVLEPDQTRRQAFKKMMPTIYMLRCKQGYTFRQIANALNHMGFKITESTVRVYYSQFFPAVEEKCIAEMNELQNQYANAQKEIEHPISEAISDDRSEETRSRMQAMFD